MLMPSSNGLSFLESALATVALGLVALKTARQGERRHLGWAFLTLAMLANTLGEATWWLIQQTQGEVPVSSVADIVYLAFYPSLPSGWSCCRWHPSGSSSAGGSRWIWERVPGRHARLLVFGIGPALAGSPIDKVELATALAYPAGDVALFWALLVLISRPVPAASQPALRLLAGGVAVMLVTDSLYSYQAITGVYASGDFLDLGYTVMCILYGLAAMRAKSRSCRETWTAGAPARRTMDPRAARELEPGTAVCGDAVRLCAAGVGPLPPDRGRLPGAGGVPGGDHRALEHPGSCWRCQRTTRSASRSGSSPRACCGRGSSWSDGSMCAPGNCRRRMRRSKGKSSSTRRRKRCCGPRFWRRSASEEVHHRVKNNLQIVSSLFSLQSQNARDAALADALIDEQARIRAMSLIHEKLYASPDLAGSTLRTIRACRAPHLPHLPAACGPDPAGDGRAGGVAERGHGGAVRADRERIGRQRAASTAFRMAGAARCASRWSGWTRARCG